MEEKIEKIEERISKFLLKFPRIARLLHYDLDGTKETNRSKKEKVNLEGMSELSKTIFNGYQRRRTKAQKERFIALLRSYGFRTEESSGTPEQVDSIKRINKDKEETQPDSCNLVLGDVEKAKIIISAHYDTPTRAYLKQPIVRSIHKKNKQPKEKRKKYTAKIFYIFITLVAFITLLAIITVLENCFGIPFQSYFPAIVFSLSFILSILLYIYFVSCYIPNYYNYNDNTSGVITLCELVHAMTEKEKASVAFVLFDNEELKCKGSEYFKKCHSKANLDKKLLLNFDCVADGSHIFFVFKNNNPYEATIRSVFNDDSSKLRDTNGLAVDFQYQNAFKTESDHQNFATGVGVGAFHQSKLGFYYLSHIHTKKDTHFDMDNIHYLVEGTKRLLKELP